MSDYDEIFEPEEMEAEEPVPQPDFSPAPPSRPPRPPRRTTYTPRRRQRPSVFWPIMLIGIGIILLLSQLGYVPWESWGIVWRLWPLLLVALGIDLMIGRRSVAGAIVSTIVILLLVGSIVALVFFAQAVPRLADWVQPAEMSFAHIEHPLEDLEQASVYIDWTSVPAFLSALDDSANLIEGEISYLGELVFEVNEANGRADVRVDQVYNGNIPVPWSSSERSSRRWDVQLTPSIPIDLTLDSGSGSCDFDLSELQLERLFLDSGSGSVDLALPEGDYSVTMDTGSGSVSIDLPEDVEAAIVLDSGSGSFNPGSRFTLVDGEWDDDGVWETDGFDSAELTITFTIDQGSGSITIR